VQMLKLLDFSSTVVVVNVGQSSLSGRELLESNHELLRGELRAELQMN